MSELPDFTVAREYIPGAGYAVWVRFEGFWHSTNGSGLRDEQFWKLCHDAVVVALPTARELSREQAQGCIKARSL